jgi:hypothetical protein
MEPVIVKTSGGCRLTMKVSDDGVVLSPVCGCGCEDGLAADDVRSIRDALNVWLTEADRSGWGRTA